MKFLGGVYCNSVWNPSDMESDSCALWRCLLCYSKTTRCLLVTTFYNKVCVFNADHNPGAGHDANPCAAHYCVRHARKAIRCCVLCQRPIHARVTYFCVFKPVHEHVQRDVVCQAKVESCATWCFVLRIPKIEPASTTCYLCWVRTYLHHCTPSRWQSSRCHIARVSLMRGSKRFRASWSVQPLSSKTANP